MLCIFGIFHGLLLPPAKFYKNMDFFNKFLSTTKLLAPPKKFMTSSMQHLSPWQQNFRATELLTCNIFCFPYALVKDID